MAMNRRHAVAGLLAAAALSAGAQAPAADVPNTFFGEPMPEAGWSEAVLVVSDLAHMMMMLERLAGWQVQRRGAVPAAVLRLWGLPAGAKAIDALIVNPGDRAGFVRLVQFSGVSAQVQIRSSAMPWDHGGIYSLMTR